MRQMKAMGGEGSGAATGRRPVVPSEFTTRPTPDGGQEPVVRLGDPPDMDSLRQALPAWCTTAKDRAALTRWLMAASKDGVLTTGAVIALPELEAMRAASCPTAPFKAAAAKYASMTSTNWTTETNRNLRVAELKEQRALDQGQSTYLAALDGAQRRDPRRVKVEPKPKPPKAAAPTASTASTSNIMMDATLVTSSKDLVAAILLARLSDPLHSVDAVLLARPDLLATIVVQGLDEVHLVVLLDGVTTRAELALRLRAPVQAALADAERLLVGRAARAATAAEGDAITQQAARLADAAARVADATDGLPAALAHQIADSGFFLRAFDAPTQRALAARCHEKLAALQRLADGDQATRTRLAVALAGKSIDAVTTLLRPYGLDPGLAEELCTEDGRAPAASAVVEQTLGAEVERQLAATQRLQLALARHFDLALLPKDAAVALLGDRLRDIGLDAKEFPFAGSEPKNLAQRAFLRGLRHESGLRTAAEASAFVTTMALGVAGGIGADKIASTIAKRLNLVDRVGGHVMTRVHEVYTAESFVYLGFGERAELRQKMLTGALWIAGEEVVLAVFKMGGEALEKKLAAALADLPLVKQRAFGLALSEAVRDWASLTLTERSDTGWRLVIDLAKKKLPAAGWSQIEKALVGGAA